MRELADLFYEKFVDDLDVGFRDEPSPDLVVPGDWHDEAEHKALNEL